MANFTKWEDIHDYNRKLMEDDWNSGQNFVIKNKWKTESGVSQLILSLIY